LLKLPSASVFPKQQCLHEVFLDMICAVSLILLLIVFYVFVFLWRPFRLTPRTVAELIAAVERVDALELDGLLDETKEQNLQTGSSAARFQRAQRSRARLLFEYLQRMSFNSLLILSWSYAEQERVLSPGMPPDEETIRAVEELIRAGTELRIYAIVALAKLSWRLLLDGLRIATLRRIAGLRYAAKIDGLDAHGRLATAAARLGATEGSEALQRLAVLLRDSSS
jgi:hypothetical protein